MPVKRVQPKSENYISFKSSKMPHVGTVTNNIFRPTSTNLKAFQSLLKFDSLKCQPRFPRSFPEIPPLAKSAWSPDDDGSFGLGAETSTSFNARLTGIRLMSNCRAMAPRVGGPARRIGLTVTPVLCELNYGTATVTGLRMGLSLWVSASAQIGYHCLTVLQLERLYRLLLGMRRRCECCQDFNLFQW